MAIDRADAQVIAEEIGKQLSKYQTLSGNKTGSSGGTGGFGAAADSMFSGLTGRIADLGGGLSMAKAAITESLTTWRQLGDSGATFNNDVIGMRAAASGSRVSLGEFADTVSKNTTSFIGLGGSVNSGTNAFAKMSKEMADSGATESLKQMGYSNKEINDILALQIGFQRTTIGLDKSGKADSIDAAKNLAREMDMMAKLTGVSRTAQEDSMKKAQADSQVEAKMRLIGIQEGPIAEAAARKMYAEQYKDAEIRGQGQMFKEVFATGHVMSEEAANQFALSGEAGRATSNQAKAVAAGNYEEAKRFNNQAQVEAVKNSRDVNQLMMVSLGEAGGVVSKVMGDNLMRVRTTDEAIAAIRKDEAWAGVSDEKVLAEAKRRIYNEQLAKDKEDKELAGSASTKAMIAFGNRMGDAESALLNGFVKPINEKLYPAANAAARLLNGVAGNTTFAKEAEAIARRGLAPAAAPVNRPGAPAIIQNVPTRPAASQSGLIGDVAATISNITGTIANATITGINTLAVNGIPKFAEGGTVDEPTLAVVGDAGREHMIPDVKLQGFIQSLKQEMQTSIAQVAGTTGGESTTTSMDATTLKEVLDSLNRLNTTLGGMAVNTESIKDASMKQIVVTRSLADDRFA